MVHYHTNRHDVGYLPETEPNMFETFEDAWSSVKEDVDAHIDYYSQGDETEIIRGQVGGNVTAKDEMAEVERQVAEFDRNLTDPAYRKEAETKGLYIVLEDGIAVIELEPCAETHDPDEYGD